MRERRRTSDRREEGAQTRRTDHAHTPQAFGEWVTTFNLRWVEHLKRGAAGGANRDGLTGA